MRGSFRTLLDRIKCVEVGVCRGDNAEDMLKNLPLAKFDFVDSYDLKNPTIQFSDSFEQITEENRDAFIQKVKDRLLPYDENNRIAWFIEDSVITSQRFPDEFFDYVYIDAEHDYESVKRDIEAWYPKVKKGGILGGHDYGAEVEKAVNEKFPQSENGEGSDWWIIK